MKTDQRKVRIILLSVFAAALLPVIFLSNSWYYGLERYASLHGDKDWVTFSVEESFIPDGTEIEILVSEELENRVDIYYTLDGSTPTRNSTRYDGPIVLSAEGRRVCFPLKVVLIQGLQTSRVYTKTYFPIDSVVLSDEFFVVSLSGEPDDFYDQERGILALGAATQEEANQDASLPLSLVLDKRGNYFGTGIEWERPVTVEIYDSEGNCMIAQQAGIRVTGGASRDNPQKSLRLYARSEYDPAFTKFSSVMFGEEFSSDGSMTPVLEYDRIDLRNAGNDWPFTMLGDATMRMFAREAGMAPVGEPLPAVVYLNGEYYGIAWMQPDYDTKNIAEMCALETPENIQIAENPPKSPGEGNMISEDHPELTEEFNELYRIAAGTDLTRPENAAALEELMDVDNFLLYYALQIYCNNMDWPHNNYKAWRYVGATEAEMASNPYADGRWRFLLYDLDPAYGTYADPPEYFEALLGPENRSFMLQNILKNPDYRSRFLNLWSWMMQTVFDAEYAHDLIWEYKDILEPELLYRESTDPDQRFFDHNYRQILYVKIELFLDSREQIAEEKLVQYLGLDPTKTYRLSVAAPQIGGTVYIDSIRVEGDVSYTFYRDATAVLRCDTGAGTALSGWTVNGVFIPQQELRIDPYDYSDSEEIRVSPVLTADDSAGLLLSSLRYRSEENYISVRNYGTVPIQLQGFSLVKNGSEVVYPLPDLVLQPGETLIVWEADDSLSAEQLGSYAGKFDLRHGDTLTLVYGEELVDSLFLPAKNPDLVYRRSEDTSFWVWAASEEG